MTSQPEHAVKTLDAPETLIATTEASTASVVAVAPEAVPVPDVTTKKPQVEKRVKRKKNQNPQNGDGATKSGNGGNNNAFPTNEEIKSFVGWHMIHPFKSVVTTPDEVTEEVKAGDNDLEFRLMGFNVLAPGSVRRDAYPFCNDRCLKWVYRKKLILKFVEQSQADLICMQELDESSFHSFFLKEFQALGFNAKFKHGKRSKHGIAILYKASKFEEVSYKTIKYRKIAVGLQEPEFDELNKGNVGQIIALKPKASAENNTVRKGIILANTHLYWNWKYEWVKLKQMEMLLDTVMSFKKELDSDSINFSPVFSGDFNLCPDSMVYRVITGGGTLSDKEKLAFLMPSDHLEEDAQSLTKVRDQGMEGWNDYMRPPRTEYDHKRLRDLEPVLDRWMNPNNPSLMPLLGSAYGNYSKLGLVEPCIFWNGEPPFTCYVIWQGTLDYLFLIRNRDEEWKGQDATKGLQLVNVMELPTEEKLKNFQTGLPNDFIPSDHLPVMATYRLQKYQS